MCISVARKYTLNGFHTLSDAPMQQWPQQKVNVTAAVRSMLGAGDAVQCPHYVMLPPGQMADSALVSHGSWLSFLDAMASHTHDMKLMACAVESRSCAGHGWSSNAF